MGAQHLVELTPKDSTAHGLLITESTGGPTASCGLRLALQCPAMFSTYNFLGAGRKNRLLSSRLTFPASCFRGKLGDGRVATNRRDQSFASYGARLLCAFGHL